MKIHETKTYKWDLFNNALTYKKQIMNPKDLILHHKPQYLTSYKITK